MLPSTSSTPSWYSPRTILTALAFGTGALFIMISWITISAAGSQAVTDPRELMITLGSGLPGPLGSILIGLMAGIMEANTLVTTLVMFALSKRYRRPLW